VYEDQVEDYPLYGTARAVHILCLRAAFQERDDETR
jgi:hypothetical protein